MKRVNSNPYPQTWGPPTTYATRTDKIIIVMVGLPARGKSYIARRLSQYISFFYGAPCRVFNVGDYRRRSAGSVVQDASFFDPNNEEALRMRHEASETALSELVDWMKSIEPKRLDTGEDCYISGDFGAVAFFDATNTSAERRKWIIDKVLPTGAKVIFLESICRDEQIITRNIIASKVGVKDYVGVDPEAAVRDFRERIEKYERVYEEIHEKELSWIKLIDAGREIAMNNIRGFLPSKIAQFLMNLHMTRTPFYLSRHGQSEYNRLGKIGGDSLLTEMGEEYAIKLGEWASTNICHDAEGSIVPARLWTSSLQRTIRTARHVPHPVITGPGAETDWIQMRPKVFRNIDEIFAGTCDGMTYEEIGELYPDEAASRKADKFAYRYPRGESYIDLIARLEPIALEMERQREPLLIVGHQAIHRVLYGYLMGFPREKCIKVEIPLNTVIKITPTEAGCEEERFTLIQEPPNVNLDPASH